MKSDLFDRGGWICDMDAFGCGHYREAMRESGTVVKVFKDARGRYIDVRSSDVYDDLIGWRYEA